MSLVITKKHHLLIFKTFHNWLVVFLENKVFLTIPNNKIIITIWFINSFIEKYLIVHSLDKYFAATFFLLESFGNCLSLLRSFTKIFDSVTFIIPISLDTQANYFSLFQFIYIWKCVTSTKTHFASAILWFIIVEVYMRAIGLTQLISLLLCLWFQSVLFFHEVTF